MTSDNICPWCYVGLKRLRKAIAQLDPNKVQIKLKFLPFFLDSSLGTGIDKLEHYRRKFGESRMSTMIPRMKAVGAEEGIQFSYGGKIGNTLLSHCLVDYVQNRYPQFTESLINKLFSAYFENEEDISDPILLTDLAAKVGLNREEISQVFANHEGEAQVKNEVINAYRKGITGVPYFEIGDQQVVAGAEQPQTFLQVFRQMGLYDK